MQHDDDFEIGTVDNALLSYGGGHVALRKHNDTSGDASPSSDAR